MICGRISRRGFLKHKKMGDKNSENSDDHFTVAAKVQMTGILMKRPFGHHSNKWTKRFFVVKDGFLLYYSENEKKMFEKKSCFNIHPKGVIPLGGSTVEPTSDASQPYLLRISSDEYISGHFVLAADCEMEREKWLNILQEASRITWKNSQLSELMIKELECQGLQLSKEKQKYFHKLQEETIALRDEIDKNEELEKITAELEKEKKKLEGMIFQFQEEHQQTFKELEETAEALKILEEQNSQLKYTTDMLQTTLQDLAEERERTLELLKKRDQENLQLFCTTEELHKDLREIEEETQMLLQEKQELEAKVTNNEIQAKMLEEEKQIFSEQADHLLSSLNDLEAQKEVTETELKEEIIARMSAERKLKEAEESLQRLEVGLKCDSTSVLMREKLLPDVKNLKKYFEHIAEEARIDADKPFIMKNAILARKAYIQRVRTLRLKSAREEKERSFANIFPEQTSSDCRLRRTQSVSLTNTAQQKIKTLHRTMSTRAARTSLPPLRDLGKSFPPLKE